MLRTALAAQGATEAVAPTSIRAVNIRKSMLGDVMIVVLITLMGIPYIFQFPVQISEPIAKQLIVESEKDRAAGQA